MIDKGIDLRLYSVLQSDHRGSFGPAVSATFSGVPYWPKTLSRYRFIRERLAARRMSNTLMNDIKSGWVPDVIWERHSLFSDAGYHVYRKTRIPWVLEVNAPASLERQRYETLPVKHWAKRWEKQILSSAPHVIAVSSWLENWLHTKMNCPQAVHIPNGTSDLSGNPTRGRALLGISDPRPILGFVGADKPWQSWRELIPIAKALQLQLVLIGPFSTVDDAVGKMVYHPQDLADIVSSFDVAAAPYTQDAPAWFSPLKIALYRGQGVPVAATDIADCRLAVGDRGGVICRPHDRLEDSLRRCLTMPRQVTRRLGHVV